MLQAALKNHKRRPGTKSYNKLETMAAAKEINTDSAVAALLPDLSSILTPKKNIEQH